MRATIAYVVKGFLGSTLIHYASGHLDHTENFRIQVIDSQCAQLVHNFNGLLHKPVYKVGVFSSEGDDLAFQYYNVTFSQYLTATAGQRFDPPIRFEMVPVTFSSLMNMAETESVDFMYASSAVSSCMATEHQVQPLVTVINQRKARGYVYDLDQYGGVIFTLADNTRVNELEDLRGKTVGAGGITMMGGGQSQLYLLEEHNISFVADLKQMVFTGDEVKTVQGVLDGEFEVGFARTDQIERHSDADGKLLNPDVFKVINAKARVMDDGKLFPFLSSTSLHPEWPVCALKHVSTDVSREVQEALLALREHALSLQVGQNLRCETTPELANLASTASAAGVFTGFRTARSYFEVRTKQQSAGVLRKDHHGDWHCSRGDNVYEDIECPAKYFKVEEELFHTACARMGLDCKEGYQCYCKPCVEPEETIFQYFDANHPDFLSRNSSSDCEEMSLCGEIEQGKEIVMRVVDDVKRTNVTVEAWIHFEAETLTLPVSGATDDPWAYEMSFSLQETGVGIMEIRFDGEEIRNSPVRVNVVARQCAIEFPGSGKIAADDGSCVCAEGTIPIREGCMTVTMFAVGGCLLGLFVIGIIVFYWMRYSRYKNDQLWQVNIDDLHFDDPVEVIGHGSFGVVLLAEYRGTRVAIKRTMKTRAERRSASISGSGKLSSSKSRREMRVLEEEKEEEGREDNMESQAISPWIVSDSGGGIDEYDLGFLNSENASRSKWGVFFPWIKKSKPGYHSQFKASILGESLSDDDSPTLASAMCLCADGCSREREEFMSEMRTLSRLRHPCITTVMGAVVAHTREPMLVMEHMQHGSLYDLLRNESMFFGGDIILQIMRDVAQGLRYLHTSNPPILHGDLKSRNILIDSRFRAKLWYVGFFHASASHTTYSDFGLSAKKKKNISGTPFWLPPEYLRGESHYNTTADIYAVGIVIYEIYSRRSPYSGQDFKTTMRKVCNRRINKRPDIPENCPTKIVDLMKKCWNSDPSSRPPARYLDMTLMDMNLHDVEPLVQSGRQAPQSNLSLDELFPKHIAKALKAGKKVEPESHELVTIIFSDIISFTDISNELSPLKVSEMLDRLYHAFDRIANKHYVFKIETIGDAYMGVTNLEGNQDDNHVKHIAEFAVDMVNEASKVLIDEEDPSKGFVSIRVGFHSGAVVSNVIGSLNPRYSIFGDAVNTASRMESNSEENRILCSKRSAQLLQEQAPKMPIRKRGKIKVKGKGDMDVYWIGDELTTSSANFMHSENKRVLFASNASMDITNLSD